MNKSINTIDNLRKQNKVQEHLESFLEKFIDPVVAFELSVELTQQGSPFEIKELEND